MADKKDNRCWPGYEPVEGKPPHSQGSCRPEPESKLTDSEKTFREKRKRQLNKWQKEHPQTKKSAAQHLHAPGTKTRKSAAKATKRTSAAKTKKRTRDSK